ncbi:MAG: hypothetical protein JJ971_07525 [Balneolaceae bacterium]|nr:hypothetical protein [Balneolaceae bacterium]MBO6546916.1 hypothetical protein [Balneolaceae bacterium]MBO6649276.1 hypothetical protein [Balneolaceae bacterium]
MANKNSTHTSDQLREKLLGIHSSLQRKEQQNALFGGIILFLVWITALILIEQIFYLVPSVKITLLILLVGVTGISIWMGLRSLRSTSFIEFYRSFAKTSNLKELSYALDLEKSSNANPKLVEAAIFKNLEQVNPQVLNESLTAFLSSSRITSELRLKQNIALASLVILLITGFGFQSSSARLVQFWETFEKPNPFTFSVHPGNITQEQGTPFTASITYKDALPKRVSLMVKTPVEDDFRSRNMDASGSTYSSIPFDLNNNLEYYIEMDGYSSPIYNASVQLRPRFSQLEVVITPPEYTGLDSTLLRYPFSLVQGYQGSQINISGVANKSLNEFSLLKRKGHVDLQTDDSLIFSFSYELADPDTLSFNLADENGLRNQNPFQFTIEPVQDEYPYVELLQPSESFEAVDPSLIDLLFRPSDDFALTSASLNYELRKAFVEEPLTGTIKLKRPGNGVLQSFPWDVSDLELKPKDELLFWIEVSDNDGYQGYKTSRSELISLTVPSLIDYFDDLGDQEDEVETDLEGISEAFDEMSEQYDTFKEQLKENPETNFEQQRQLQEVQRQQEEIEERIEELNEKFEEIKEELSENNMLSEETMEAYQELQELMEEIDDPAFREALQKLQEQMSEMSPEQLRDALQDAEFNEELYKQRLERTLELFKQLKLNSDLEKLAEAYDDLARQEEEMESRTGDTQAQEEQRKSTLEQTEQLKNQIEELSENTTSKTEEPVNAYQEMSQKELESIQQELKKMLEELQKEGAQQNSDSDENSDQNNSESQSGDQSQQQNQQNQQQQKNLKESFQKLAEMTRNTMEQMQQQQMNVNIAGLQYILYSLLNLSVEQEDLVEYASSTENRSQAYIEYAREQKNVEDIFISLSDSLFALSKDIPQFSNQINEKKEEVERLLTNSLEQMAERNQNRASVATRQAMGGINEIAFMIANLLEQLQNSSSGGGGSGGMSMQQMMEQMQQMGENQQQLNQQMQDLINDMQGERLTQDQMDRLNQLSRQQNAIRQQLQELQRNGELEGGDKLGSEIERMIEEMEDTINDLRGGAVDPTLIERQQNILSRMLEAEQALQERDEEEKREGTTGQDIRQSTPPELTLEELEKQIRNRLNDPNFTKYSADYQRLIERYFELLKLIQEREVQ